MEVESSGFSRRKVRVLGEEEDEAYKRFLIMEQ